MAKHLKGDASAAAKARIVKAYARSGHLEIAAGAAGIGRATLDRWRAADPKFEDALSRARFKLADEYLSELHVERDNKQRRWWLATQFPERFAARQHVELTGAGGGPVQIQSLAIVVAENDVARGLYHGLLASLAGTDRDGESRGALVGGDQGQPDPVAALPAQPRAGRRPARRLEAAKT